MGQCCWGGRTGTWYQLRPGIDSQTKGYYDRYRGSNRDKPVSIFS